MQKFFSILLLLFSIVFVQAQDSHSSIYEITSETSAYEIVSEQYVQILSDRGNTWTIQQVNSSPLVNQFSPTAPNFNYFSTHTHWQRFRLHNVTVKEVSVGFFENTGFFRANENVNYYLLHQDGSLENKQSGWSTPWSKMEGLRQERFSPFNLQPNEVATVYRRVYNSYRAPFPVFSIAIGATPKVKALYIDSDYGYFNAIQNSFNLGFCFFASLFSIFFFFIIRERVYLYFASYIFFLGLGRSDVVLYDLFMREYPFQWAYLLLYGIWPLTIFFLVQFIRHFLKTFEYLPRLDSVLLVVNFTTIVIGILYWFFPPVSLASGKIAMAFWILVGPTVIIMALTTFFFVLHKTNWSNKLLSYGVFPSFAVWGVLLTTHRIYEMVQIVLYSAPNAFGLWLYKWWNLIETICLGLQVIFFSWLLLHRFSDQRKQIAQLAVEKERERNQLIEKQKKDLEQQVTERTAELTHSLQELKATQAQLIHSEKMASLGELTAGIAHEIQNPLNFVNNFSEINTELLKELKQELGKGDIQEVDLIISDVIENEQKITLHGKRADSIVKGMLQHSRVNIGHKELTDLNVLTEEYLRLAYFGFKAKNKNFDTKIDTQFDTCIGKVNVVPQEIGRLLLNLFNNAFYSVWKKKEQYKGAYDPTLKVSTEMMVDRLLITVQDNGFGIPRNLIDKIFQPFFTTKPTNEGTGLGLSLGYDIVKAHGGELIVESQEDGGAKFIISIPLS